MRKPSKKTWLVLAVVVASIITTLFVLPEIFPDGNGSVNYWNLSTLERAYEEKKPLSVEDVEAILGPAHHIVVGPHPGRTVETRFYYGRRDRYGGRLKVTVPFVKGQMLYAVSETGPDPTLLTKIRSQLESWFPSLRQP